MPHSLTAIFHLQKKEKDIIRGYANFALDDNFLCILCTDTIGRVNLSQIRYFKITERLSADMS